MKKKKNRKSAKRRVLSTICVILAIVLAAMLLVTFYADHLLGKINLSDGKWETLSREELEELLNPSEEIDPDFTGPVLSGDEIDWGTSPDHSIGKEKEIINILLIGQDTRGAARGRSDSMILCTINTAKKSITLTSFLRDLYVQIPGYADNRINAAYALGGPDLLNATLEKNFGIHVDGNVEVDFNQFTKIIDLIGGVEMELTGSEAGYINMVAEGNYVTSGTNLLDGKLALIYARNRHDIDGDFSRTNRQRKLLTAVFEKYKTAKLTTQLSLLEEILPMITTNLTKGEIVDYATDVLPLLTGSEINTLHIPTDDGYSNAVINGMMVLVPDLEVNNQAIRDMLGS